MSNVVAHNTAYTRKAQLEAEADLQKAIEAGKALAEACADYRNELAAVTRYIDHMGLTEEFNDWVRENG